jgi:Flp pilus assembly pilin Flp
MCERLGKMWREEDGVLSFEWTLLTTLVVLGVVGGLTAARDAIIDELGDAAQAMLALDGSYTIDWPLQIAIDTNTSDNGGVPDPVVVGLASDSGFLDALAYSDCGRTSAPAGQPHVADQDS